MVDFYLRFRAGANAPADAGPMRTADVGLARAVTLGWAVFATLAAMFVDRLGTIVKAMGVINGFFVGPLLSVFLLGFLTRRANSFGAFTGAIVGTAMTAVVATMPVAWLPSALQPPAVFPLSWVWYGPVGCLVTLAIGYGSSLLRPAPDPQEVAALTRRGVRSVGAVIHSAARS
jgi:SSS family solute:Na+ symporter